MKYILNNSKINTTNNYKINNLEVNLDIPKITNFNTFKSNIKLREEITDNFTSKINLEYSKSYKVILDVKEEKDVFLEYNFDKENILINEIEINLYQNSDIFIKYYSAYEVYNNVKLVINADNNSKSNISIINLINKESKSFIAVENYLNNNSEIKLNFIDLGGNLRVSNIDSKLNNDSKFELNNIYIGKNIDIIDMNYNIDFIGKKSKGIMNIEGILDDNSKKSFKGILDFKRGAIKSVGNELENIILLSDNVKTKSLPMLLCDEEDVIGNHGVSTGKIDSAKLFYLMSRGLSEKESKKIIIMSNFRKIIKEIKNDELSSYLLTYLDKII